MQGAPGPKLVNKTRRSQTQLQNAWNLSRLAELPQSGSGEPQRSQKKIAVLEKIAVLIVEDDFWIRSHVVTSFEDEGFETFQASSATGALSILEGHPEIRAVFTDIEISGSMDGLGLSHVVRSRWPPTMIFIGSGRARPAAGEMPHDVEFLAKPYHPEHLAGIFGKIRQSSAAH
jgi:two-component system, response regulator PdtaR